MIARLPSLWRCKRAAAGAEFALVLPLMLTMLFMTLDVGRFMWEVNRAEKATQMGARFAVVTTPVSSGLVDADFASDDVPAGELIPAEALGKLVCTSSGCVCTDCDVSVGAGVDSTAFTALVTRMKAFKPDVDSSKVVVTYRGSGFGFAGNPAADTMEISPLVTVSLTDMEFVPLTTFGLATLGLPASSTTLPAEDASGAFSN